MREIKFQIWDPINKIMLDWDDIGVLSTPDLHGHELTDDEPEHFHLALVFENLQKKGKFRQFTGLKDKNGKEIYFKDYLEIDEELYIVGWNEETAGFYLDHAIEDKYSGFDEFTSDDWEVIGNIYENPELLK